jgi:hypothetical protein
VNAPFGHEESPILEKLISLGGIELNLSVVYSLSGGRCHNTAIVQVNGSYSKVRIILYDTAADGIRCIHC